MKKNAYYATVFQRRNIVKDLFYMFFRSLASWPRLVLEVFIRRDMGERYFSLFGVIAITLLLLCFPFYKAGVYAQGWTVVKENFTWYLFTAAFVYASFLRWREIQLQPSVFDFERFSLFSGCYLSIIRKLTPNVRRIDTLIEPGACFIIGLFLKWLHQPVGILIMGCSVIYSLSYVAAYARGDDFLMDHIDNMICQEDLAKTFIEGLSPEQMRGAGYIGHRPDDPELRRKMAGAFEAEETAHEVS